MAEGAIKPDIEGYDTSDPDNRMSEKTMLDVQLPLSVSTYSRPQIIWTPRFIVVFSLTLVFGLSIESLLTQGWLNGSYTGAWIFQAQVTLVCSSWLALLIFTHSSWIRIGAIFGIIWAFFMTLRIVLNSLPSNVAIHIDALVNAATCIALLGSYICLSIDKVPISRLDAFFFGLMPIISCLTVALIYFLTPPTERSLITIENTIATVALILSLLVWWIRPTSWKNQPGPTFLFGCVPLILITLALSAKEFNSSNYFLAKVIMRPIPYLLANESNFFFSQVALLCLLLGITRILQCERVTASKDKQKS
jgi:hypothetical protein